MQAKKCQPFSEKINYHDKIPWHFPDIGQMAKIPWHFFKIPWQFPDLEKILFFPDFSLTRGNPVWGRGEGCNSYRAVFLSINIPH